MILLASSKKGSRKCRRWRWSRDDVVSHLKLLTRKHSCHSQRRRGPNCDARRAACCQQLQWFTQNSYHDHFVSDKNWVRPDDKHNWWELPGHMGTSNCCPHLPGRRRSPWRQQWWWTHITKIELWDWSFLFSGRKIEQSLQFPFVNADQTIRLQALINVLVY